MPAGVASLDPPRWQRAREIFDAVADLDPAARPARLAALCAGDEALLHEVESLLTHDRSSDDALGRVVEEAARDAQALEEQSHELRRLMSQFKIKSVKSASVAAADRPSPAPLVLSPV